MRTMISGSACVFPMRLHFMFLAESTAIMSGSGDQKILMSYENTFRTVQRLMCDRVTGPLFFLESNASGYVYLDMLVNFAVPQLQDIEDTTIYQQHGAPPHWALQVHDFLRETFSNRWIGRDGPIPWTPRLPHITPLDFFLWEYVKDIVYKLQFLIL